MPGSVNILDLSVLPPSARRELRDFYHFLLTRQTLSRKPATKGVRNSSYADLCGTLSWKGDAVAVQRSMRDEW